MKSGGVRKIFVKCKKTPFCGFISFFNLIPQPLLMSLLKLNIYLLIVSVSFFALLGCRKTDHSSSHLKLPTN